MRLRFCKSIMVCAFFALFALGCNSSGGDSQNGRDKEAPSVPANLSIYSSQPDNSVQIKWTDSTDNVGVEGYKIYRNGAYIASSISNSYQDSNATAGGRCCYAVSAFDASGNESSTSAPLCADTSNGKVKWSFKTESTVTGSLALSSDGTVYGKDERYLYAINPDGSLKWKYSPGDMIMSDSSPVIAHDGAICLKTEFFLYVVKPDGNLKWKIETPKYRYYTDYSGYLATGQDGTIYTVSSDSIKAINADGTEKWQALGMYSNMTLDEEGLIYTSGYSVEVLSPDGTPKGQIGPVVTSGYQSSSSPVIGSRGEILVSVLDHPAHGLPDSYFFHAFKADGTKLWSNDTDRIFGTPVIGGRGTIYACAHGNGGTLVCAMNPDGTMKWKSDENAYFMRSLAVDESGVVYIMSMDGCLNAIEDGGKLKWKSRVGASYASPAIAEDGTIYVGSENSVYAISSDSPGLPSGVWSRSLGDNSNSRSIMKIKADTELPSIPQSATASAIASSMIQIGWDASSDALNPVTGYKVFRNGEYIGLKGRGFTDSGLNHSTKYCYQISAVDAAGNESGKSLEICASPKQPAEGVLKWKRRTYLGSLPAYGQDGSLVMWSGYRRFAINPDGTEKWSYQTGNIDSSPLSIGSDGTIYSGQVSAFYPEGNEKWSYDEPSESRSPSISNNGTLYVAGSSSFWAINPDGTLKWKYHEANSGGYYISFRDSSIASDGTVYTSTYDDMIFAFNPDGSIKWKYQKTDFYPEESLAIGPDGTVYTTGYGQGILAINPDGTLKWQKNSFDGMTIYKVVVGEDGTIYSSGSSNYVYAFSPDGLIKWKYSDSETVNFESTLIGVDGVLYVGSYDGFIIALNHDGTLKWKYKAGAGVVEPYSITSDGTLYFGSNGEGEYPGYLYAIQTNSMGLATGGWPKIRHDNRNTGQMP